jgi:hypothetical protein
MSGANRYRQTSNEVASCALRYGFSRLMCLRQGDKL